MIPKVINYCWFGGKPLDDMAIKCINSWKKHCPDYKVIQWDESNYDINKNDYVKEAYKSGKWAFVTDYVRLDVLYENGGIYFDTDVELIKNIDPLLKNVAFVGLESAGEVNTGLGIGCEAGTDIVKQLRDVYDECHFIVNGKQNTKTCVDYVSEYLKNKGLNDKDEEQVIDHLTIYPVRFFCPIKAGHKKAVITTDTYSIHHFAASWYKDGKLKKKIKYILIPLKKRLKISINKLFGNGTYERIKGKFGR